MNWQETVNFFSLCLPAPVGKALRAARAGSVQEIRVRADRQVCLQTLSGVMGCSVTPTQDQVSAMAEALCEHALYARAEESRQGFVTLRGGHRMGLCGRVVASGQTVRALREIGSLCIRIAGEWPGTADAVMPYLADRQGRPLGTLVIGLPGRGKTTLLRDICRQLGDRGLRMCVADERSELAAASHGAPQLDVGRHTDVLDGLCKEAALRWLLRSMSPDALVTDELGDVGDAQAVLEAAQSGVPVIASVHGRDLEGALARGTMYHLRQNHAFSRYAVMSENGPFRVEALYDERLQPIALGGAS